MQRGLLARHAPEDLVAFGAKGARTARELLQDVAKVARALPDAPEGAEVLLVIREDRYALAVAMLAAWARDYVPVLPPELDRDAITTLADAAGTATVLHDTASGIPLQIAGLLRETEDVAPLAVSVFDGRALASRGYGRTAAGALQPEAWANDWLRQAQTLRELMGIEAGQRCATSVAPGHAHNAVLGVLAPLLAGAAFLREPLAAGELGARLAELSIDVLVSVPAHLPALLERAAEARRAVRTVLSALEPLPPALAAQASAALGARVNDLSPAAALAPILHCTSTRLPDRAAEDLTRDTALEALLRVAPGVRDAAFLRVGAAHSPRLYVALTGEAADPAALRASLANASGLGAEQVELLTLGKIRRDGIGRVQRGELLRHFGLRADGSAVNCSLHWGPSAVRELGDTLEHRTSVHVPVDYAYFDGHFSGYPILPGAAQLSQLLLPYARSVRPNLVRLVAMSRLKFSGRIKPGDTIDVVLTARADATAIDFALRCGATVCSAGTLSFAREAP